LTIGISCAAGPEHIHKNAIRQAKWLRLIEVEHRRIGCAYNDANRIRIISKEWVTWLAHTTSTTQPVRKLTTTNNQNEAYDGPGGCLGFTR